MTQNRNHTTPETEVFFHLGMKKAASTFLQRKVFPHFRGVQFFKKHDYHLHTNPSVFQNPGKYLFSYESLEEQDEMLEEILAHHPKPKIIYVLREPVRWIVSYYKYYIRKHGYKDFADFLNLEGGESVLDPEELYFSKKVDQLREASNGDILLVDFNDLKDKPWQTLDHISAFIGCDYDRDDVDLRKVNKAFDIDQLHALKKYNGWYRYSPSTSKSKAVRFIHYKYREFLLHILAFIVGFFPKSGRDLDSLITPQQLEEVRKKYAEDWAKCLNYLETNRQREITKHSA